MQLLWHTYIRKLQKLTDLLEGREHCHTSGVGATDDSVRVVEPQLYDGRMDGGVGTAVQIIQSNFIIITSPLQDGVKTIMCCIPVEGACCIP